MNSIGQKNHAADITFFIKIIDNCPQSLYAKI